MQIFFSKFSENYDSSVNSPSTISIYKQWDNLPVHSRWWVVTLWHTSWQTHFIRAPAPGSSLCQRSAHSRCNNKMMPNLYLLPILIVSIHSIGGTGDKINGMISEICIITIFSLPKINYIYLLLKPVSSATPALAEAKTAPKWERRPAPAPSTRTSSASRWQRTVKMIDW